LCLHIDQNRELFFTISSSQKDPDPDLDPDPDPKFLIQYEDPDPDPKIFISDPEHWFLEMVVLLRNLIYIIFSYGKLSKKSF